MSINHLLKSPTTSVGCLSENIATEDTNMPENGKSSDTPVNSAPDTTTQTKITCNLSPCFSAFDVAVLGAGGTEVVDCVQLQYGLPHSSYTICNIVMEQPIVSPTDSKTYVYNSDVAVDEVAAYPQTEHRPKQEKINSATRSDQKVTCVKTITDCKKPKNADTTNIHVPNSSITQDSKIAKSMKVVADFEKPNVTSLPSNSVTHDSKLPKSVTDCKKPKTADTSSLLVHNSPITHDSKLSTSVKVVTDCKKPKSADASNLHLPSSSIRHNAQDLRYHRQPPPTMESPVTLRPTADVTRVYNSLNQARPEMQTVVERQYKCEHKGCDKSFAYQMHLLFHIQHAHLDYTPYMCNVEGCGRCFYTEDHLFVHLRGHTEVKPFICPYEKCKKAFGTTGNLRNHIRTHTGEKPYKCSHKGCNKGFAELSSVKKHELTHTGEKPYPCRICGRCFSQVGSRNTHERHRHKDVFTS